MTLIARDGRLKKKKKNNRERRLWFESFPVFRRGSRGFKAPNASQFGDQPQDRPMFVSSACRQEAPRCGEQAGRGPWGVGGRAHPDGDDRSVVGIHVPLTCYCELPAAPADNCHLSQGRRSQRDKPSLCLCRCLLLAPRSPASSPALNPGD